MEKKKHPAGLTEAEAIESRRQHGTNILTPAAKIPLWKQFLEKFSDPIIRILLIALLASAAIAGFEYFHEGANQGDPGVFMEPVGILVAVLLATGIGFWFEVKANRAFDVLNEVNDEDAVQVIRDGSVREIAKKDVVVGDWVILNAGNEIPADGTLQEAVSLQVDESTLTGEPLVSKSVRPEDFDKEATYATNYVLRGTTVVDGHGLMCVEVVGDRTENGKVFVASQIDNSVKTPLNLQLEGLGNVITKISYVLAALIIIGRVVTFFSAGQGDPVAFVAYLLQTIMIAVTLIVVAVPEGLPMSVTLSLALSMRRMLRTHNLVRKMHACETMGATTVICTDKTGTLTQNQMRVHEMRLFENADRPAGETARLAAEGIAVNSTAFLSEDDAEGNVKVMGNPTEGALLLFLRGEGADYAALREEAETISQLTFSTERKYMATVVRSGVKPGHYVLYVKGAPEIVLRLCRQTAGNISRDEIDHMLKTYQGQAMRTLGFAFQELDNDSRELFREGTLDTSAGAADGLTFVGLAAIADPVRKEVPGAVAACIGAGIDIKIVTGDTPGTAREIGRQIGLWQAADNVRNEITGPEFAALTDTELEERIMDLKIISRARPMDKKRLVETLQSKGQVVAVTGDGTNDAPALKAAHVGLSMGDGTSVAKEASDITIMDNSFSSITRAVMWGRSLYHNIQRFILFQMTINVAACLIVLAGAFLGTHSPLTVTQMLWVNLIMDTFAAMALASLPPTVDVMRDKRSLLELSEIADLTVKEQLQTIPEVSSVSIWGEKRYCMRLWLDPVKMSGYRITPMDVKNALDRENVELPSGSVEGNTRELTIRTMGQMHTTEEFNNLVIKESEGRIVRFSDIGRAELSARDLKSYMKMNGVPMVGVVVVPQPGANHINIADAVYTRMEQMKKDLPEDVKYSYGFDNTRFIRASINEVKSTVYEAFVLVIIIIFLFLRDWRVTLVPCIVIPVSLIGAFFIMYVCGFSINVLSMLAIVLAVGLVVDDAIVMTENIYIRIEQGMKPLEAGIDGAKEIFFAVISTTITLVAVFFPIVFMEGTTGRLFREFSFVVAGSVIISSFAALTFTPMLATKLLVKRERQSWFYRKTEPFFAGLNRIYSRSLNAFLRQRRLAIVIMAVAVGASIWMWTNIPSEMAPMEDRSNITIRTTGPEGVTYEYMRDYTEEIARLADSIVPDAAFITARVSSGSGNIRITLDDLSERDYSQMEVAEKLSKAVQKKTDARAFVQQQSTFGGRRGSMPVQYVLQATNIEKLQEVLPKFMAKVYDNPTFQMADVDLKFSMPELRLSVNRDKASLLGVSTRDIAQTLQYGLSGQRLGYLYMNGKQYEIIGEINRQQRNDPNNLKAIYMRSADGKMIQMENLVDLMESIAPPKLYRYNRFVSATISAGLADGKTIGEGLDEMDKIAKSTLDETFRTALAGDSKEFRESSSSLIFAFGLALLLIYLILAAQFESFKDPFVIMLTVPLAICGALIFMTVGGQTMNIFSQIGIIMLIGLVAKNGILIVEFANQRQKSGEDKMTAIRESAAQRLRPILMTSTSTILGLLPLMLATGEGCNGRIAMGTAVVGGMLLSTLLTMYIVPAIYSYVSTNLIKKKS